MSTRTKVVIVDDDEIAIDLLSSMLADYSDMELVGVAGNAKQGLSLLEEFNPDVILKHQKTLVDYEY